MTLSYPPPPPPKNALKQKPAENEPRLCCEKPEMGDNIRHQTSSLRSKRLLWVSEQTKTREHDFRFWPREKWNESHFFAQSLTLVPRSLLPNHTETLATQTTTFPNGELPHMLPNKSILPLCRSVFMGLPARTTPNREMSRVYVKKRTKRRTEPPACPIPASMGPTFPFCGKWTGHFRSSGGQI